MKITWLLAFFHEVVGCLFTGKTPFANTVKHLNSQAPKYHWGNLGYWREHTAYAPAAQALADELLKDIDREGIDKEGEVVSEAVLVLGCGHGEELRHWATSKPPHVTQAMYGVDLDAGAIEKARECYPQGVFDVDTADHFLKDAKTKQQSFDVICALDCAYHFEGRAQTWQCAYDQLAPNGVLAISDLVIADNVVLGIKSRLWLKLASAVFSIPYKNWLSSTAYTNELSVMGFNVKHSQSCGVEVLDGFCEFTQGPLFNDPKYNHVAKSWMIKSKITGYLIKQLRDRKLIDYQIIQAYKNQ